VSALALGVALLATQEITKPRPIEFRLVDVSASLGLGRYQAMDGKGTGLAAADYDDDGDIDLFFPAEDADQLYVNQLLEGGGGFQERAAAAGLASTARNRVALWFDADGDQDLDLFRANDDPADSTSFRLHVQDGTGQFRDSTAGAQLDVNANDDPLTHRGGVCAGDLNNDGLLELYCAAWGGIQRLFLNTGGGRFLEIGETSEVGVFEHQWQPMMVDLDEDGWQDLFVAVDYTANRLWINQGDLTFVDAAFSANAGNAMSDMGAYIVDYDDDGDLDLFTTNIEFYDGLGTPTEYNVLLENRSDETGLEFVEVSRDVGVWRASWAWGTTIFDADNDGLLEFAATNGFKADEWERDRSRLWTRLHPGSRKYTEDGRGVGLDDRLWGSALVSLDFDRDGDLDLAQSTMEGIPRLLENRLWGASRNYLVVRPRMNGANRRAIGATVTVTVAGRSSRRLISAGTSFFGQEPAEAFFGLGDVEVVDSIRIEFPGGQARVLTNVPAGQVLTLTL